MSETPRKLEALPDEIFLEIFQYVNSVDLHSFSELNRRLRRIVRDVKVNVVIQWQEEEELVCLASLIPTQVVRLEMRDYWPSFDLRKMVEVRSLTMDCTYLSPQQLNQVSDVVLPYLERLSVYNVTYDLRGPLLDVLFEGEHFPSLKFCHLKLRQIYNLELNHSQVPVNNLLRSLVLEKWHLYDLNALLSATPNLRRLETNFEGSSWMEKDSVQPHLLLTHLRVTLCQPVGDLEKLLIYTPNLLRLRVRGKIEGSSAFKHFERLAKLVRSLVLHLQQFDCELYFYSTEYRSDEYMVPKLHPLFKSIQCLRGHNKRNQCYASDITEYPVRNEYEYAEVQLTTYESHYYDDHDDYHNDYDGENEYDNGFTDYGLGYRGNYKMNYGSSPWSGNND